MQTLGIKSYISENTLKMLWKESVNIRRICAITRVVGNSGTLHFSRNYTNRVTLNLLPHPHHIIIRIRTLKWICKKMCSLQGQNYTDCSLSGWNKLLSNRMIDITVPVSHKDLMEVHLFLIKSSWLAETYSETYFSHSEQHRVLAVRPDWGLGPGRVTNDKRIPDI